jgi:hypothetical protein
MPATRGRTQITPFRGCTGGHADDRIAAQSESLCDETWGPQPARGSAGEAGFWPAGELR